MKSLIVAASLIVVLAGCTAPSSSSSALSPASAPAPGASGSAAVSLEPSIAVTDYKVTYGFAVPSGPVRVTHTVPVPPLRTLVGVYVGDHPTDNPAFQRMSFYFRDGYP